MKFFIIILFSLFLMGCTNKPSRLELAEKAFKVGDEFVLKRGHYKGCEFKINNVKITYNCN